METAYLLLIIFLFILAAFDLSVGVSNDAVNFLNSAIGAKVATFRTILIVASVGIFLGAATSDGMMEVARKGIFRPEMFTYKELMVVFIAVMVSDIILIDIFNTLGMPTSTTVSLVFDLLGASFAVSLIKIVEDPTGMLSVADLINTEKALSVIMAIFVSVAVAFIFGTVVQFLSRLFFTFSYKSKLKWKIGIFGGIASTAILYFMLIKSFGHSPYMPEAIKSFIDNNLALVVAGIFLISSAIMQILHFLKVSVFKIIVLMGTFALAMAFAGNDLVNFIGVPLAGYSSFLDFSANGNGDAANYMMGALNGPANTNPIFLVAAGVIMVVALATSKKAMKVVNTSVGLAKQNAGDEVFGSAKTARVLVRTFSNIAKSVSNTIPEGAKRWINSRMNIDEAEITRGAAFDEVRATINLVVASLLIALGTSMKLPLSTTYVTFMVAMGSSLADKAWGRESAVFRITGVLSVIGGWFITAGGAFTISLIMATIMFFGGNTMIVIIIGIVIFMLLRNNLRSSKKKEEEADDVLFKEILESEDETQTLTLVTQHINLKQTELLNRVIDSYKTVTDSFINEDLKGLEKTENQIKKFRSDLKTIRRKEMIGLRKVAPVVAIEKNTWFHLGINSCEEIIFCLRRICDACLEHIDNNFVPLSQDRVKEFIPLRDTLLFMMKRIQDVIEVGDYRAAAELKVKCDEIEEYFSQARKDHIARMQSSHDNIAISYVYLNLIQESQQLIISLRHLLRAARHLNES